MGYSPLQAGIRTLAWTAMPLFIAPAAGALSDRIGARQAYGAGLALFVAASAACGLASTMGVLVAARLAQGAGAAVMMPASLALIREAYHDAAKRAGAIAIWSVGAGVASAAGPVIGGTRASRSGLGRLHAPRAGRSRARRP